MIITDTWEESSETSEVVEYSAANRSNSKRLENVNETGSRVYHRIRVVLRTLNDLMRTDDERYFVEIATGDVPYVA